MAEKKLTPKQERFVQEYLIDLNATQAAIRAGYSEKNAGKIGPELLGKTRITEAIQEAMTKREKRTEVTQDQVINELAKIGFSNISDYLRVAEFEVIADYEKGEDGEPDKSKPITRRVKGVEIYNTDDIDREKLDTISEVRQTRDGISIKLHDKLKALELLGKHMGMFTDKIQHEFGEDGVLKVQFVGSEDAE